MKRVVELDALRGLAACAIVVFHLRFSPIFYGWTRVDMFFVLSGLLSTVVILKAQEAGAQRRSSFFTRRLLRLAPMYFAALLGLMTVNGLLPTPAPTDGLLYYLTFTQNVPAYWGGEVPDFSRHFFHTWSLALEVQFALIWPILVGLTGRRWLAWLCVPCIVLGYTARELGVSPVILLGRIDSYALGGLLAALVSDPETLRRRRTALRLTFVLVGAIAGGVLLWGKFDGWGAVLPAPSATILASAVANFALIGLIVCHAGHPALGILRSWPLRALGQISFGIYLFHPIVFRAVVLLGRNLGIERSPALEVVMGLASIAVAAVSWQILEKPAIELRSRLTARRAEAPAGVPAWAARGVEPGT